MIASGHWTDDVIVGLDVETTAVDPQQARLVTACVAACGATGVATAQWVIDAGVEIPEEATAVHGVSTEQARRDGQPIAVALPELLGVLESCLADGAPLAVFNARYDLTVLAREAERLGVVPLGDRVALRVIDPLVLDKWLDRYRSGPRTLAAMCAHFGARLDRLEGVHGASSDAIAAARLAWVLGRRARVVRRVRDAQEEREFVALVARWEEARQDLDALHALQVEEALAERVRFADYKHSIGQVEEAARIRSEVGWPVLDAPPQPVAPDQLDLGV